MLVTINVQHNETFIFAAALEKTASLEMVGNELRLEGDLIVATAVTTDEDGSFNLTLVDPDCMYAFAELINALSEELGEWDPAAQGAAAAKADDATSEPTYLDLVTA